MGATRILGAQGDSNTSFVGQFIKSDTSFKADTSTDIVFMTNGGTCTLPDAPYVGEQVIVVADGSSCTVEGGANPLFGGPIVVDANGSLPLVFSPSGQWLQADANTPSFLSQNTWYIDPVLGNNSNTGLLPTQALKTWAQFQTRICTSAVCGALFTPTGSIASVFILNDLPDSDPITWDITTGPDVQVLVSGKTKNLRPSTTITSVINRNPALNVPNQVRDATLASWTPFVGKYIEITTGAAAGARALICKDVGSNTAHVSEWAITTCNGADGINCFPPPTTPVAGDKYIIVDMTKVCWGEVTMRGRSGLSQNIPFPPWNNLAFTQLSIQPIGGYATDGTNGNQQIVRCGSSEGNWTDESFVSCIIDLGVFGPYWSFACNVTVLNCWCCCVEVTPECSIFSQAGVYTAARPQNNENISFTALNIGGAMYAGQIPTFLYQGPTASGFGGLLNGPGRLICGSFAVFYAGDLPDGGEHWPLRVDLGGNMISFIVDIATGEPGLPPIWGANPNSAPIDLVSGNVWPMQTIFAGTIPTVTINPAFTFDVEFGTAGIFDNIDPVIGGGSMGYGWNSAAAKWQAPPALMKWSNLLVAVGGGGFMTATNANGTVSTMAQPSQGSMLCYQNFSS